MARFTEVGRAITDFFAPLPVIITSPDEGSTINLIVADFEIATFGPGRPLECVDAVYGFVAHLATNPTAEA